MNSRVKLSSSCILNPSKNQWWWEMKEEERWKEQRMRNYFVFATLSSRIQSGESVSLVSMCTSPSSGRRRKHTEKGFCLDLLHPILSSSGDLTPHWSVHHWSQRKMSSQSYNLIFYSIFFSSSDLRLVFIDWTHFLFYFFL